MARDNLHTLRHFEEVREVGVLALEHCCLIFGRHGVQVDEVGQYLGHKENVTGLLHGFEAVWFERGEIVCCFYEVDPGISV